MYLNDKDFEQKRRFQKILWAMGYWSRIDIPVVVYEDDDKNERLHRHELTDIDVYGEITQPDFSVIKSIGDCKSGRNVKIFERLFWVRGIKDYLNAEHAYLIKRNISSKAKLFMPKIDVKGIDDESLLEMEKIYCSLHLNLFSEEYYRKRSEIIDQLMDENEKIYNYMKTRYWYTDLNVGLNQLMIMLKTRDFYKTFTPNNKAHSFLLLEICMMLTRALFDCCKFVLSRDIINIETSVREYIHGGVDGYSNKMQVARKVNVLFKELRTEDIINTLIMTPDYFEELVKIIAVLIGESLYIKDAIRYIEIMQHEIILETSIDYTQITGLQYSPVTHKIAKDIIVFYLKANKIDTHFFDEIFLK